MPTCKTVIKYKGQEVFCYGDVRPDSNFQIICVDEAKDGIYANGNPDDELNGFKNWTEAVHFLIDNYSDDIEELTAC